MEEISLDEFGFGTEEVVSIESDDFSEALIDGDEIPF